MDASATIWSPGAEAALAAAVTAAGFPVVEWPGGAGDLLVIVDARHDETGAIEALNAWGAGALVLLPDADPARQDRMIAAGATQVAVVDGTGDGLTQALLLAARARDYGADRRRQPVAQPRSGASRWLGARLERGEAVTVVHVAMRRLDLVNAAHGRGAGTALIDMAERRIAAQVDAVADGEGQVVRLPGPAFAALIVGRAERAITAAARIDEALARPFRLDGGPDKKWAVLGTAIGLAGARPGEDADALLARAAAQATPVTPSAEDDPLAVDIHRAIAAGEVALLFQPQARLADGAIVGVEALARWQHPHHGLLGAEELLAAADRAGISAALAEHIRRRVLAEVAAWPHSLAGLDVALNLTPGDLARPGGVETMLAQVDASGVARDRLTLEVTEGEAMADLAAAAEGLAALRAGGCRTAIDDFGTGYSSLAWLASLPIDYLKLDRDLAQDIVGSERSRLVVTGAIDLARSLGLAVIAEGVETEEQRDALAAAGCAVMQGFLLAPPLASDALVRLVGGRE